MSTQDPTISKRSQNLRQRHKAEGDKSCLLWLSPTTQARVARLKQEGETLAQLFDRALSALEKNRQDVPQDTPGVANSVAKRQPEDRQRVEVWVPDDLVDSLRAFLLGGVANSVAQQREGVANSVAEQHAIVANSVAEQRESVAKPVAQQRLVAQVEELRKQGVSFRDIARRWNAEGTPTLSGKGQWHGASVAKLVGEAAREATSITGEAINAQTVEPEEAVALSDIPSPPVALSTDTPTVTTLPEPPARLPPKSVAALSRRAKRLSAQGVSWKAIAQRFNAEGVPTLSGIGQWHGSTVKHMVEKQGRE